MRISRVVLGISAIVFSLSAVMFVLNVYESADVPIGWLAMISAISLVITISNWRSAEASVSRIMFDTSLAMFLVFASLVALNAYDRRYHPEFPWREGEYDRIISQLAAVAAISLVVALGSFLYRRVRR